MADPARVSAAEAERRRELGYPPATAMAVVSGPSAERWMEGFGRPPGVDVLGPSDGKWLLRAPDHEALCTAMATVARPAGARPPRGRSPPPLTRSLPVLVARSRRRRQGSATRTRRKGGQGVGSGEAVQAERRAS